MAEPRPKFIPKNKSSIQYRIWRLVTSTPFELFILIMIVCNTIVLMLRYYQRDFDFADSIVESTFESRMEYNNYHQALTYLNHAFIVLFTVECLLKIAALNPKNYFMDLWNVFDFVTVIGSITDVMITNAKTEGFIHVVPNIGFLRLFRAARILKLLRQISGIRIILWTFVQSFKSLPYVVLFIFTLFFIYCVVGMQLFGDINLNADSQIHAYNNFQNFGQGMLLLFRCATGENWQEIMVACEEGQKCFCASSSCIPRTDCGNDIAYFYFITFSFITTYLMFNIFIAVLMENFDYLTRDFSILGPHHLDEFIEKWSNYDAEAKGEIDYMDVYDLLTSMEPPLGFGKNCPYRVAYRRLIRMNMPVISSKVNFTTTLMALIKEGLNIKNGNPNESDIQDMELRWCIAKLWPKLSKEKIKLLVPTEQETSYPNLTIGKVYTCMRIFENWRGFKAATGGRRVQIRMECVKHCDDDQTGAPTSNECVSHKPVAKIVTQNMDSVDENQIARTMYQNLAQYLGRNLKIPPAVHVSSENDKQILNNEMQVKSENALPSQHFESIVSDICRIYHLKVDGNIHQTTKF